MKKGNVVGHSVTRVDAVDKVLGKSIFAADLRMQDMLCAKVLRSAYAHANIKGINTKKAEKLPGVVAVLTSKDVPGKNGYGIIFKDQPVLADDKVRHFGDAVAVVAAVTEEIAEKALKLIEVDYEELPAVFSSVEAMEENAPKVHDNNILLYKKIRKGNIDEALKNSAIVITNEYKTQSIEHCYIEPEAGIAYMDGDTIVVKVATQNPHYDRKDVALNLGLPLNKIRIIQTTTGGGFGGKLDISVQCHLALLTLKTKRPVKMVYDREESFIASAKRHPFVISYTTGADKDGSLLAIKAKIICDTGAYASYGSATMGRAMVHATGPYEVPNVSIDSYCVYTNNPIAGAMRGFGVPQVAFAHECQMDILSEKLGMSPFEIRLKNALREGSYTATGQQLLSSVGFVETLNQAKGKGLAFLNKEGPQR
ncbi:MAG: nicotinate dehydrogenase large molybdopterin subunit [Desulfitibacter sp. BRH_c19]|nr:MAG: nicotinate dehydrogenase large molybdopterin subunit [Desulfitibacter sp. BRH_c19]